MDKNAWIKWSVLAVLVAWSLSLVYPPKEKIRLGIDLRGGTSFTLQLRLDEEQAAGQNRRELLDQAVEVVRGRIDNLGVSEPVIYPEYENLRIIVQVPDLTAEDAQRTRSLLERPAYLEFKMVHEDSDRLIRDLARRREAPAGYQWRMRDVSDGRGGVRTDYLLIRDPRAEADDERAGALRDRRRELAGFGNPPPGTEFMLMRDEHDGAEVHRAYFVERRVRLSGQHLSSARVEYAQLGQPHVAISFNAEGTRRFASLTGDYAPGGNLNREEIPRYLAILLDGRLYSAPYIRTEILGGQAVIEGAFSVAEAQDLALVLRAGSLPAPLEVMTSYTIDPTLGAAAVTAGAWAVGLGLAAVLVFMLVYYLVAGVVANLALTLDMILLPLGMMLTAGMLSLFAGGTGGGGGALTLPTLTLPGIAGIVLTIGMAVDANVLIFERIREELATGKKLKHAVEAGYEKAFSTIFDANITTLLTAAILFIKGSGPIRGFAVTLSAGIVVSMYVALMVTRMIFDLLVRKGGMERLKMLGLFKPGININLLGARHICLAVSGIALVTTAVLFGFRGPANFGIDFRGGAALVFAYDQEDGAGEVAQPEVVAALTEAGVSSPVVQYREEIRADGGLLRLLDVKTSSEDMELAKQTVLTQFADSGYRVLLEEEVGPQIGQELRRQGIWSIALALVGIIIYITFRFEFGFAMGAIAALLHDVILTVGIYTLLGRELSLISVAALLTIVGYSVNDTIVVFDRIREDIKNRQGRPYVEVANLAINQTISRTVLTSVTTLLTVVMLVVLAGPPIRDFALMLLIGILVGTYSSVFVATPTVLLWHRKD